MNPIIFRQTTYRNNREITTINVFGVTLFKRIIIDTDERARRPCGFNVFPSDAPGHFVGDFDDEDESPDDKRKSARSHGDK
jgi:hypothetical protein